MDRKTFVYNVLGDIWKVASLPEAQKHRTDMTNDDWEVLTEKLSAVSAKYYDSSEISDEQKDFFRSVWMGFLDLIAHDGMIKYYDPQKGELWVDPGPESETESKL